MWQLDIFLEGTLTDAVLMPGKLRSFMCWLVLG